MLEKKITFDKFARWTLIAVLVIAIIYAVDYLSAALLPFCIAWLFSYLLYPLVKFVQYKMRVRVRALAILVTMIFILIVLGGIIYFIVPPMLQQFSKLSDVMVVWLQENTRADNFTASLRQWIADNKTDIERYFQSREFSDAVKVALPKVFSVLGKTASIIISIVASCITLLYMFFILLDYEYLTANWIKIFPKKSRPFWRELMRDVERELNNYIRGQGLVALCMGIMFCIGLSIMDFPMAIGLGILIGIMDLVPYLHTFALIPAAFLSMLKAADTGQNFWHVFGMVVALFIIIQIITETITIPKIMGKAMRLNPAILLLSLSVWGALLGFMGLIIALPLTTLIIAYWQRYVTKEHENPPMEEKNTQ